MRRHPESIRATLALRKRKALTPARVRKLLVADYALQELDEAAELAVEEAKKSVRKKRSE